MRVKKISPAQLDEALGKGKRGRPSSVEEHALAACREPMEFVCDSEPEAYRMWQRLHSWKMAHRADFLISKRGRTVYAGPTKRGVSNGTDVPPVQKRSAQTGRGNRVSQRPRSNP